MINANSNDRTVRGGDPKEVYRGFEITTTELQEHLQAKVNNLCASGDHKEPVKVRLMSFRLSRKHGQQFVPLLLVLSESARVREKKGQGKGVDPFFRTENRSERLTIFGPIYKMVEGLRYTHNGIKWLTLPKTRKEMNIPQDRIRILNEFKDLRLVNSGKNTNVIVIWLDPLKVIYDYLIDPHNPRAKFKVRISDVKQVNSDIAIYCVKREAMKYSMNDGVENVKMKIMQQLSSLD